MRIPKVSHHPPQKMDFGPKMAKFGQNWHFWPNISIFGPFDPIPDQKTMRTSCLGGFYVMWLPKLLLTPIKTRIFGPQTAKFGPKLAFWAKYWHFWPIWSHGRPKMMRIRCLCGFSVAWVPKLLLPPVRIRIFGPKTAKFGPKYAFLVILGQIHCWPNKTQRFYFHQG